MKILNTTDPIALRQSLTEFLSESRSIYGGILDKVPESFRQEVERLKKLLDDKLAALSAQPTDQVPAANAAANSLEHLASTLAWMQEMYFGVTNGLRELMTQISPKEQALHSLHERIAQGELVEKATARRAKRRSRWPAPPA